MQATIARLGTFKLIAWVVSGALQRLQQLLHNSTDEKTHTGNGKQIARKFAFSVPAFPQVENEKFSENGHEKESVSSPPIQQTVYDKKGN